ncbi:M24 family metallopeptidase, partial [Schaalia odontolytica]|nr:M24 family metallopeptidase [Schaalia odontolytica]
EIEEFVDQYLREHGATPEQKGYQGYQYATCASINDEIYHGFPRKTPLKEGDIVTIDMVVNLNGALADSA